jgi:hypothetical protein
MDCGGKRHAAFVRATVFKNRRLARAGEGAVAAGALPAEAKTRTELPGVSEFLGACRLEARFRGTPNFFIRIGKARCLSCDNAN